MGLRRERDVEEAELPAARRVRWVLFTGLFGLLTLGFLVVPYLPQVASLHPGRDTVPAAVTWTVFQTAAVVICTVFTLYGIGRARLERAAFHADQLDIRPFVDERGEKDGETVAELSAVFKGALNESKLYQPSAVPGSGTSYDFIQIVENAAETAEGWWKAAGRLVRLVRPPSAFQITCTLRPGTRPGRRRLLLELVRAPRFAASPLVIEDDSWERVLERAANAVAALVMPRSKYCRNIYWADWQDAKIPAELFDAYQRANQFTRERRYDEALAEYYRAVEADPTNVYIRLEIGALQEQLELHLDALATYDDVVTLCARGSPGLAKWWIGGRVPRPPRRTTRRQRHALLVARYRHALVLGQGDLIAAAWWAEPRPRVADADRDAVAVHRADLRSTLSVRFERYTEAGLAERTLPGGLDHDQLLSPSAEVFTQEERKRRQVRLWAYLCALAQYEMERLLDDHHPFRFAGWAEALELSRTVSRRAVALALVWARLRRARAEACTHDGRIPELGKVWARAPDFSLSALFPGHSWPPKAAELGRAVRAGALPRLRRPYWTECYNAASVYAVALLPPVPIPPDWRGPAERDELTMQAVAELSHAASVTHSDYLARRRAWLMAEDPDLVSLRGYARFRTFETVTFSPDRPAPARPRRVRAWEEAGYLAQLVTRLGRCRAEFCACSADGAATERAAWLRVCRLASGHGDWCVRYEAIRALREWAEVCGFPDSELGFPAYDEDTLLDLHAGLRGPDVAVSGDIVQINRLATEYIDDCDERMRQLVKAVAPEVARGVRGQVARPAAWTALADWFDDGAAIEPVQVRQAKFEAALRARLVAANE